MSAVGSHIPLPDERGEAYPATLVLEYGGTRQKLTVDRVPFRIGRKPSNQLVIPDARVSREHAVILWDNGYLLLDQESRRGTYVNGVQVTRHQLQRNDRIEFGVEDCCLIFEPEQAASTVARELAVSLRHDSTSQLPDLEMLKLFLEAARKLNTTSVLDDVFSTLIDAALRLTRADRGFVFLCQQGGDLRLAAGRNQRGETVMDDSAISRSILREAVSSGSEFLVTSTEDEGKLMGRASIVAHNLRTVVCLPLRRRRIHERLGTPTETNELCGVLYLDSHMLAGKLSAVSHDLLRTISTEAAALVENAFLMQAEQAARSYQQELAIAAAIQQRLMKEQLPQMPYASLHAKSIPCREVGGDFFDAVRTPKGLAIVIADVSGKGISAALMASILQGMIYALLIENVPIAEIAGTVNRFLCQRVSGEKYATLILVLLTPDGTLEFVNCGHVRPMLISDGRVQPRTEANLPVGLMPDVTFESARLQLSSGDRLLLFTDGLTEAENASGEAFGDDPLTNAVTAAASVDDILARLTEFSPSHLEDDCTILDLTYR